MPLSFGARVQVNGQVRFATAAGSYLSSNDKRLHFGLGTVKFADIEIRWPSGIHQILRNVTADQFLAIEELTRPLDPQQRDKEAQQKTVP